MSAFEQRPGIDYDTPQKIESLAHDPEQRGAAWLEEHLSEAFYEHEAFKDCHLMGFTFLPLSEIGPKTATPLGEAPQATWYQVVLWYYPRRTSEMRVRASKRKAELELN